jgi:3-hydroxyacyl-[acyl-carrier-protein] dehydratase
MDCILGIEEIRALLPHRYPLLLVDRVVEITPGQRIVGYKNVTINEPFFNGHFPGQAVMPGVYILESMAQVAAIMMLCLPEHKGKLALMGSIDNARFRKPVVPGDSLVTEATVDWIKQSFGKVSLISRVDGQEVARCDMKFAFKVRMEASHNSVYEKITNAYRTHTADSAHISGGHTDGDPIVSIDPGDHSAQATGGEADCG